MRARSRAVCRSTLAVLMAGAVLAGCSSARPPAAGRAPATEVGSEGPAASSDGVSGGSSTSPVSASETATVPLADTAGPGSDTAAPLPTGVPGLGSGDPFCRDYARVLGTANLLGVANAFAPGEATSRAEVVSAPAQVAAAAAIVDEVPPAATPDAEAFLDGQVAPLTARAVEIDAALVAAGLDESGRDALQAAWDDVLATDDPLDPGLVVGELPTDAAVAVATALGALDLDAYLADPRTAVDPSAAPLVRQYVGQNCPEVIGLLGDAD